LQFTTNITVTLTLTSTGLNTGSEFWLYVDLNTFTGSIRWPSGTKFACAYMPVQDSNVITAFRVMWDGYALNVVERRVYGNPSYVGGYDFGHLVHFDSRAIVNTRHTGTAFAATLKTHAPAIPFAGSSLVYPGEGVFLAFSGSDVYFSYDNGVTWTTNYASPSITTISDLAASRYFNVVCLVEDGNNKAYFKADGMAFGTPWNQLGSNTLPTYATGTPHIEVPCSAQAANMAYLVWYSGGATRNVDFTTGPSWAAKTAWSPSAKTTVGCAIDHIRGYVMLLSNDGYVTVSHDKGNSWSGAAIEAIIQEYTVPVGITYIPAWHRWLAVANNTGTSISYVAWSDDDGVTWSAPTALPASVYLSVSDGFNAFDDVVYASSATDGSRPVYHLSYDGGVSWRNFNAPYGNTGASTPKIIHSRSFNRLMFLSGGEIFISDNGIKQP
jgi:hypothetical protein